jgi:hypothetical protein
MYGGEQFCFQTEQFSYTGIYRYPAPFYTAFCSFFHYLPDVLLWLWMLTPFFLVVILAGQRAAAFVYPPFYIHMRLGQSTWLLLPLYWLALIASENKRVRWWYGLFIPLAFLKPHIALLPLVWLLWIGRRQIGFWIATFISSALVLTPAFVIYPAWLGEWLAAGRGFKIASIANVNILPIHWLGLAEGMNPIVSERFGLLLLLAWGGLLAIGLLVLLWRRGELEFYDWVLVFAFTNPFMHDYDLIVLLPFIANRPKRLLIAVSAGLLVWVYSTQTTTYNASIVIPLVLIVARLLRLDAAFDARKPVIRW